VALDEKAGRVSRKRKRRREEEWSPRLDLLGLPDVGHDLLGRLPRARRNPRQRQRDPGEPEQIAPVHPPRPLNHVLGALRLAPLPGELLEALPEPRPLRPRIDRQSVFSPDHKSQVTNLTCGMSSSSPAPLGFEACIPSRASSRTPPGPLPREAPSPS